MNKEHKIQILFTLILLPLIVVVCLMGANFLKETIYLFLVQESMNADTVLMQKILNYITFYNLLHIIFIVVAVIILLVNTLLFIRSRRYKVAIFANLMSLFIIILTVMNKGLINLMKQAKNIIVAANDIVPFFDLGKDFISVTSATLNALPAKVTNSAIKAILIDSVILGIFLLVGIVLFLRLIDLRRYQKPK